jgi:orotate phosphoribosyltransferase
MTVAPLKFSAPILRDRVELFEIILRSSFGRKQVVLSSGKPSDFYFDMKPTMMNPRGAHLIAKLILPLVLEVQGHFIGGLEMGAVPIIGAVLTHSDQAETPVRGFFVRKARKEHGAKKLIEGLADGESLRDQRVVLFDDVCTSGASAMMAADVCRLEGAHVVRAIAIVDRNEGAPDHFKAKGIPFTSLFSAAEFLAVA